MEESLIDRIFEDIVETIRESLLVLDNDLKIILASRYFYEFFMVTPEETLGQMIYDLGDKQWDIPELRVLLENILLKNNHFDDFEVKHDFTAIGRRIMLLNARRIEQAADKKRIILLAIEDITERRRSETVLRESEEQYRRLFETAKDGILLLEKNKMTIRHANPAAIAKLDYANEELIGKNLKDIGFPDSMGTSHEILETLEKNGITYWKDVTVQNKLGRVIPADIHMANRAILVQCNIHDITEQKQAEKNLRESREKIHSIVDNIGIGVALIGPTMEILELNRQMNVWFPAIDLSMRPICYRTFNNPPRNEICDSCPTFRTFQDGRVHEETTMIPTAEGPRNYRIISSPIIDASGEVTAVINMVDDLTDRISLENHLRRSQQLESIGTLAGGISHDFNNILSSVLGYTELALDDVQKGTPLEGNLQEVYTAGKRARDLVKQILTFARQTEEELRPIRVDMIVREVLKFIRSSLPTTIEIKQNIESDSLIMADAVRIHQIMMNLCTNAAHAMKDDIGVLGISLEDEWIDAGSGPSAVGLPAGDYIKLAVSDTGTGISPSVIGNIFDPYFTTKDVGTGTGLGLSMVHGIVENYGGRIAVDSNLGKGTTFTVYLPVTKKHAAFRPYEQSGLATGTERILFVDDELAIAKMGGLILERLGYQVVVRTGSMEALELFKHKPNDFDLVITDMTMPNMAGDKLAGEMIKIRPDIPVILCSGYSRKMSDRIWADIGIKAFVFKPVVRADMAKTVRKVLDEAKGKTQGI